MSFENSHNTNGDPVLERDRKREELWGIHHESLKTYRASLREVSYIEEVLRIENRQGPFEMDDDVIFITALFALKRLRAVLRKRKYTKIECVERCWLERSMHQQVFVDLCFLYFRPGSFSGIEKDTMASTDRRIRLTIPLLGKDDLGEMVERVMHCKKVHRAPFEPLSLHKEEETHWSIPEDIRRKVSLWASPPTSGEQEMGKDRTRLRLLQYLKCIGQ